METKRVAKRNHGAEFKANILAACGQPSASVAAIALRNGLNANVVHRWLSQDGRTRDEGGGNRAEMTLAAGVDFLPVQLPQPAASPISSDIRMELRRGASSVTVSWPLQCSAECAAWLRDWLR